MSLADNLVEVLRKANEFVPSEAGSILLDNPRVKPASDAEHPDLPRRIRRQGGSHRRPDDPADHGIAGHVYQTGHAYFTSNVVTDSIFDPRIDRSTEYRTCSLIAIPIRIGTEVCGVLELLNREGDANYT